MVFYSLEDEIANQSLQQPVILFDGVCNLCNRMVQFVLKRDKNGVFRYASLQSSFGQTVLKQLQLSARKFNTIILLEKGKVYTKSTAALRIARHLSGIQWLYFFIIVPPFIRNGFYNVIAKHRYKWFGKRESCLLPLPHLQARFFD